MLHEIYHLLGLCGDKHPSLIYLILEWQNINHIFTYIKMLFK